MQKWKVAIGLALLTLGALAVHGYHPYAEDAEIYLPGVEKILHPSLFPVGAEFFESHASLTLFPNLIAASVRVTHMPFDYALFSWHVATILLLLWAVWELTGMLFDSPRARWGAVVMMTALLTLPVAGTSLYVMDQYLNPRNIAAFCAIFAVARVLEKKYVKAAAWLIFAGLCHPLMSSFAICFCVLLALVRAYEHGIYKRPIQSMAVAFAFPNLFAPPTPAYDQAMQFHRNHFILNWQWYEWLGIVGPVAIFWFLGRLAQRRKLFNVALLCRTLIIYDLLYFAGALVVSIPKRFEALSRIQPLRSLHIVYMLLIVIAGGFIAESILKNRVWRWLALFIPLCCGMFLAQRELFPGSSQIEWPWATTRNQWAQAFLWIRDNTPIDAIFAIDPAYIRIPGEDTDGFRAIAQRSRLADAYKDSGAVSMFPPLGEEWLQQYEAQKGWKRFSAADFARLNANYGVSWVVLQAPDAHGFDCPYRNSAVLVCRLAR